MAGKPKEYIPDKIGSFGLYQLRLFGILSYALCFTAMGLMIITFTTAEPPWRCKANSSSCTLNGNFKPGDTHYEHRCSIPRKDWEFAVEGDFDSIVTEWDLVCDDGVQASLAKSLSFLFAIVGCLTSSILSDKYGRKKMVILSNFLLCTCGLLSAFAQKYWVFALFRLLVGIGIGSIPISFTLLMEFVGTRHRGGVGFIYWKSWTLSMSLLALLGYLIQSWRLLTIITSAPGIIFILFWRWTPESVRWLQVNGKIDEAKKTLKTAARVNKKFITEDDMAHIEGDEEKERVGDIRDLFASRSMAWRTLIFFYCFFIHGLVYYGISLSAPTVGGNMYLNFFLQAVCEVIAVIVGIPAVNRFGRKKTLISGLWMAGISMIVTALLYYYDDGSKGFLAGKILSSMVFAKIFITVSFDTLALYVSELFPTVIRNTAMGINQSSINIGSFIFSYIAFSSSVHPLMPFGIMAANALISGILMITLPETNNKAMPDTLKQVELFLQDRGGDVDENPSDQPLSDLI